MEGDHLKIIYDAPQAPINHSLYVDSIKGGMQPLIGWEDLTPAARKALNTHDFGSANVPFDCWQKQTYSSVSDVTQYSAV
ncbi:NPP1 family protein [Bacillus haynesii]|uniref:NPP1 family protein n=1 Tax=Bacillus haynesii TaxID=1925021 RepID=UPI0030C6A157